MWKMNVRKVAAQIDTSYVAQQRRDERGITPSSIQIIAKHLSTSYNVYMPVKKYKRRLKSEERHSAV